MKEAKKLVSLVSLQLVKEKGFLFEPRTCLSSMSAYQLFAPFIRDKATEHLMVACLNAKGEVVNISIVHIGAVNQSLAVPREIIKVALLSNAISIVVSHNHPSGSTPSQQDIDFTQKLAKACEMLQITLHDHLIISANGDYLSMKAEGLIQEEISPSPHTNEVMGIFNVKNKG